MLYPFADSALARRYIKAQCAGWGSLSKLALAVLPSIGEFFTLTPVSHGATDPVNGSIKPPSKPAAVPGGSAVRIHNDAHLLARWIAAQLRSHERRAIIENPIARPGDRFVANAPVPVVYSEATALFVIDRAASEEMIFDTISVANLAFGHGIGIIASDEPHVARQTLDTNDLRLLIERASWIMTAAYNGETFLLGRMPI